MGLTFPKIKRDNAKSVLVLNPGYMVYEKIDVKLLEVEVEKGLTKARYSMMNENDSSDVTIVCDDEQSEAQKSTVFDVLNKTANYGNLRATDLPTVSRLYPPKPGTLRKELVMQNLKDKIISKAKEFREKRGNSSVHV